MSNHLKLLPPSLSSLIENHQVETVIKRIEKALDVAKNQQDVYLRNGHLSDLTFYQAIVADHKGQTEQAFSYAKSAYQYDTHGYHHYYAMIDVALKLGSDASLSFATEVAWWFYYSHEYLSHRNPTQFWSDEDSAQAHLGSAFKVNEGQIVQLLESYRHYPPIAQHLLEKALFSKRLSAPADNSEDLSALLALCDEYVEKGLDVLTVANHKTTVLYKFEQYNDIVSLWSELDERQIQDGWTYMRLMLSRIYSGLPLPSKLRAPEARNANLYYNLLTTIMKNDGSASRVLDDFDGQEGSIEWQHLVQQQTDIERLTRFIGEHGLSLYHDVEQGLACNGYANDAHFYAMFCRNYSIVLNRKGDKKRALQLSETGFSLSPFIQNGYGMIDIAINLGEYGVAERNIDKVKAEIGDYLDFDDMFYLESRALFLQSDKGVKAYFKALQAFKIKHADFIHNMRISMYSEPDKCPQSVLHWQDDFRIFLANCRRAFRHLHKQYPNDTDVIAYGFEVQGWFAGEDEVHWLSSFEDKLRQVQNDKTAPNNRSRLFHALLGYGHLVLRRGELENRKSDYKKGINLLEEAIALCPQVDVQGDTEMMRLLGDAYLKIGRCQHLRLNKHEDAEIALTKAIAILKEYGSKTTSMGFEGDALLSLAYFYRGKARDNVVEKKRLDDNTIADDFIQFCQFNDSDESYLGAYEVAYLLMIDKDRVDEQYDYAMRYIDEMESIDPNQNERGYLMAATAMNLLRYGDKSRAKPLIEALEVDFPKQYDLRRLKKWLRR